jgi:TusA-related sulfurtransferase
MVALMFTIFGSVCAQSNEEAKKEINRIKKNSRLYIYADVTAATTDEAANLAEEQLYDEINKWVATKKKLRNSANIVVNNKKELWATVNMPRGNMYRSFIYVKKNDILPADNVEVISNNPISEPLISRIRVRLSNHKFSRFAAPLLKLR